MFSFSKKGYSGQLLTALALTTSMAAATASVPANAETAAEIDAGVQSTLGELAAIDPSLKELEQDAVATLVIPEITKATFIVGGAYGEGALMVDGQTQSYWSYAAASLGYQIGAQETRQVMFFMTEDALAKFREADGFEVGADVELTVIEKGGEVAVDSTKDTKPVVVVVFDREGLLGGASIQGGKYSQIVR